jgi:hypothetical protein
MTFGLEVSPSFADGPLRRVSPRALQLFLILASKATHYPATRVWATQTITLQPGETLYSMRVLKREVGCGISQLLRALRELEDCGAITAEAIKQPATFSNRKRARSQNENVGTLETPPPTFSKRERQRSGNENALKCVATRIKIHGVKWLAKKQNVLDSETHRYTQKRRDRDELARADTILTAEGR